MDNTTAAAIQEARELIRAGKRQEARKILVAVVEANQEITEAWYLLGCAVSGSERQLSAFRQVLRIDPSNHSAQSQIAKILAAQAGASVVEEASVTLPFSILERWVYGSMTLIQPPICFLAVWLLRSFIFPHEETATAFSTLFLQPEVSVYFFPFLLYSMLALLCVMIRPSSARILIVRLGVFTGFLLGLQYVILVYSLLPWMAFILPLPLFFMPLIIAVIMARVSWVILRDYRYSLLANESLAFVAWGLAYLIAWHFALIRVIELFSTLTLYQPPVSCYVATAASRGHARLVRPRTVILANGERVRITQQLLTLKCGELAILTVWPRFHTLLRKIYDSLGPPLARRLNNPYLADLAYLGLKPFEWATALALKVIIPEIDEYAGRLYGAQK